MVAGRLGGRPSEASRCSGRSGAVAARAPEDLLPTVAVSAVDAAALPRTAAQRACGGCVPAGSLAVAGGGLHGVPEWQWDRGAAGRGRASDPLALGRDGDGDGADLAPCGLSAGGEVETGAPGPAPAAVVRTPGPGRSGQERAGEWPRRSGGVASERRLEGFLRFGFRKVGQMELSSCPSGEEANWCLPTASTHPFQ